MILTHHFDALMFFPENTASDRISREHFKMIDRFSYDSENKHCQEITSHTGNQKEIAPFTDYKRHRIDLWFLPPSVLLRF